MTEPAEMFSRDAVELLPAALARAYHSIPRRLVGRCVEVLTADPEDSQVASELAFALNREVRLLKCAPREIDRLIQQHYGRARDAPKLGAEVFRPGAPQATTEPSADDLTAMSDQPPVIRLVNQVLSESIADHASDIHFEPFEDEFRIRVRVDGALYALAAPARELALPVISRIKVLANLDIAERRVPQDGRIRATFSGRTVDLRVSTLPTQFGESVVLRILDQAAVGLEISALGLSASVLAGIGEVVHRPHGILLVTGPTGSGKTTTLYSGLRAVSTPGLKVLTIEDPVEYEIEGLMQVPINPAAGLTFASALRALLRQDPDVIMVGEIRDLETAQIAIQAALTGHLVLSTLHTNDAPSAVTRLVDMGVEPFLLGGTLDAVLAQRLVRRICPRCRVAHRPAEELLRAFEPVRPDTAERPYFRGRGCRHCGQTGYRGRLGLFEWMMMKDDLRELVTHRSPAQQIREAARRRGMVTLREEGLRAAWAGATTLEEVARYT